jgi:GTP-binding protein
MFIDETTIKVAAGDGGNGCYAYDRRRGKATGKPSGGSGGRGGHVIVRATAHLHTLQDASYHRSYRAQRGVHGKGSNRTGANGKDVLIPLPLGTVVRDEKTGRIICDCVEDGKTYVVARGGRGGKGNAALVTRGNPHPERSQPGRQGEHKRLLLSLKVLADIGLVGRPNAGKSTFLSRVTKARPKVAAYPFTTTQPHLGIVPLPGSYSSVVMADIPGLIEGSHTGRGLGIRFLKHIERTRVLAVLVDVLSEDPRAEAEMLLHELAAYSPVLAKRPLCFVLTKTDLCEGRPRAPQGWLAMSSVTGEGVDSVLQELRRLWESLPADEAPTRRL